jgi:hypothetical protein
MLSDLTAEASSAQTLAALRQFTTSFHDTTNAVAAGFTLFIAPVTAADGCISDATPGAGGMGYHYINNGGRNIGDDSVALLDPEFIVYAPDKGPSNNGDVRRRLAAVEYFLPFSAKWPAKLDASFKRAPTLHDFSTMSQLPDVEFTETTRFGGWMFHIWVWENNPDGMFANFNSAVPLCG